MIESAHAGRTTGSSAILAALAYRRLARLLSALAPGETLSNLPQPDNVPPDDPRPDPAAAPPSAPDATRPPDPTGAPISGQPWSTPSGDPLSPQPYQPPAPPPPPTFAPGYASLPQPAPWPANPPTSQFPSAAPAWPVNYAPPGQAPDYGAPNYSPADYPGGGYPPPGYPGRPGYAPAGPPPRKSNIPLVAVIVAVALLLCGGVVTTGVLLTRSVADKAKEAVKPLTDPTWPTNVPALPTDVPGIPGLPSDLPTDGSGLTGQKINVTYEVTGNGPAEIIYVEKLGAGPTRLDNVSLPWKFTTSMDTPALVSVIAIRVDTTDGQVTCRARVNGQEVKKSTSGKSAYATAACTYFAID